MLKQEKQTQVGELLQTAKQRGYLLLDEMNKILSVAEDSAEETDELLSSLERDGIEITRMLRKRPLRAPELV